jgi:uncharacterized YigZ family protein
MYPVPAKEARKEIVVGGSRFIASLAPVFSVEEAKGFVAQIRQEFRDATHHVSAYLVGGGNSVVAHAADDGEPAGTAGRPALAVLRGSGLGDVAVVVTRYFGGTKLGTGGLVKAYTQAVQAVVAEVPRAQKVLAHRVRLKIPYSFLERVRLLVEREEGEVLSESFAAEVTMMLRFPVTRFASFQDGLRELSAGRLKAEVVETGEVLLAWNT